MRSTDYEPKTIIVGYIGFQRRQRLRTQEDQHIMLELIAEAQALIVATQESCHEAGEANLYLFLVTFEGLMHRLWEAAEEVSQAHALIVSELLDASRIYLAGEDQLYPEQLAPLATVMALLLRDNLTVKDAAEADRTLLASGINAIFPVNGDLVSHYTEKDVEPR